MEIQISDSKRIQLEAATILYDTKQVFVQWKDKEQTGSEWETVPGNSKVAELANAGNYDSYVSKTEADKIEMIKTLIIASQVQAPVVPVGNSLNIPISPLTDGTARTVQVYDMKINYSEKNVRLYTRCVYSDSRDPKYVSLTADNGTLFPDGQGGTIGEYDYLFYKVNVLKESLIDVQTEVIQMRSTPEGGARWD